ncbi:MAG TPA: DsbA family oxidoreductase [Planctomycetaceae bacterium]|nr:DsbA family oxidoreductase [Planctomycetaceae bacterium]
MKLLIDVISDVICPWCYIGKRRLEKAIAAFDGQHDVRVKWHPFQLNPAMPKEGISRREYRIRKFGSWERSMELDAKIIAVGTTEGIHFAFDKMEQTPNTVDAHRLIWLADQHGCQGEVVEALFRAYFIEGIDIGNQQTLIDVAAELGLDRQSVETMLNSDAGLEVIAQAGELSQRQDVTGVPFIIINNAITLSGAQAPETFIEAFRQAVESK